jgi:N-acetylmuramoyl-L-alanine amidase
VGLLVYPPDNHKTDSKTIFFIGSADEFCLINDKPVTLSGSGNFAHVVNLELGDNTFSINLDGKSIQRKIQAKYSAHEFPVAYARPYQAFSAPSTKPENILRSVLVNKNLIRIPLNLKPDYRCDLESPYRAVLSLGDMKRDLDWIYYEDEFGIKIKPLDSPGVFELIFLNPVKDLVASWHANELRIKISYISYVELRPVKSLTCSNPMIVIDPGHGGSQVGATSPKGVFEKDLNLQVSLKLRDELKQLGIRSQLTRQDDSLVTLDERVELSKESDIFLSLHHNALPDGQDPNFVRGFSVHYYYANSHNFCLEIAHYLKKHLDLPFAGFYRQNLKVLRDNSCPLAVLIELGYLIHPEESDLISSEEFQDKSAKLIANFLFEFINRE